MQQVIKKCSTGRNSKFCVILGS